MILDSFLKCVWFRFRPVCCSVWFSCFLMMSALSRLWYCSPIVWSNWVRMWPLPSCISVFPWMKSCMDYEFSNCRHRHTIVHSLDIFGRYVIQLTTYERILSPWNIIHIYEYIYIWILCFTCGSFHSWRRSCICIQKCTTIQGITITIYEIFLIYIYICITFA